MTQPISGSQFVVPGGQLTLPRHLAFGSLVFICAVLLRLSLLDDPLFFDEMYHVLAGASWAENGTLTLYEGAYERAPLYTQLTGAIFSYMGGTDIVAARVPNVLFGAGLVVAASVWVRIIAGPVAGWLTALFLLFWPNGIYMSQIIRFYAVHGILFFVGAMAIYDLLMPDRSAIRRGIMVVLAAATLWLSLQFQDSTLIGLLAICMWIGLYLILPAILRLPKATAIGIIGAGLAVVIIGAFVASDTLRALWVEYRTTPWDRDPTAYHRTLRNLYPTFWPLTPVFALLALSRFPRPASFCLSIAGTGIVMHSFAGVQNIRHIYYISPFLFALWAMGLQAVWRPVIDYVWDATRGMFGDWGGRWLTYLTVGIAGLFVFAANDAVMDSIKGLRNGILPSRTVAVDYEPARTAITAHRADGAVVVVTDDLEAVKYFDGFDVNFSRNWLPVMEDVEFAKDPRTGRPLISENASLEKIVQAYPKGIFVTTPRWWREWPGYNSIIAFLDVFNKPGVDWQIDYVGPSVILAWESEVGESPESDRVRALIDRD